MEPDFSKFTTEDWKNYKPEIPEADEKAEKQAAIIEIRAGQGGDEAGLFAKDLYRMYSRYGQTKGWREKGWGSIFGLPFAAVGQEAAQGNNGSTMGSSFC